MDVDNPEPMTANRDPDHFPDEPPAPPKRGRPLGSKTDPNRKKKKHAPSSDAAPHPPPRTRVRLDMPPELQEMLAMLPLSLASNGAARASKGRVVLRYTPQSVAMVTASFKAWMRSKEVALTPGWGLVLAYGLALEQAAELAAQDLARKGMEPPEEPSPPPEGFANGATAFHGQPGGGGPAPAPPV